MISHNAKSVICDFLPTEVLVHKISKLSSIDRKSLITQNMDILEKRGNLLVKIMSVNMIMYNDYNFFEKTNFFESLKYLLSITNGLKIDMHQSEGYRFRHSIITVLELENAAYDLGKPVVIFRNGAIQEGLNTYQFSFDLRN